MKGSMFAGYNKCDNRGVLLGNWVEEEALRQTTGSSRYKGWINHDGTSSPLPQRGARVMESSSDRVMIQDENYSAKEYRSTSNVGAPSSHPESHIPKTIGPRTRRRMQSLQDAAKQIVEVHSHQVVDASNTTTSSESYKAPSAEYLSSLPKPISRGKGKGVPIHPTLHGQTRRQIEHADQELMNAFEKKSDYTRGTAITLYSHNIRQGKGLNFPMSASSGQNPFARSTAFTNDIRDPRLRHAEASDTGSSDPIPLGMTIQQRSIIEKIQSFLQLKGLPLSSLRQCLCNIHSEGCFNMNDLYLALTNYGIEITKKEVETLFHCFYAFEQFRINHFFREIHLNRRQLIFNVYLKLQNLNHGRVTYDILQTHYDPTQQYHILDGNNILNEVIDKFRNEWGMHPSDNEISIEEWQEFYTRISEDIVDEDSFAYLLCSTWHVQMNSS